MYTRLPVPQSKQPRSSFLPVGHRLLPQPSTKTAEPPVLPPILHDMLPKFQAKLTVGQPNDQYEQEADQVADQVMRMPEPKIQRVCPECEEELQRQEDEDEEERLQTKPLAEQITPLVQRQAESMEDEEEEDLLQTKTTSHQTPIVSSSLQNQITGLQGGGQPLPHSERAFFEPRFGHDFSQVRVHTDSQAAETASAVNARAFTLGRDIVFGAGQYQPNASEGRRLLAHELTHVIQQQGSHYKQKTDEQQNKDAFQPKIILQREIFDTPRRRQSQRVSSRRPLVVIDIDTEVARIDTSKGIDEITRDFYNIPVELLPPNTPIPVGPILTIGSYGCNIRRYGLTVDNFSLTYTLNDSDIRSSRHPFRILEGDRLSTVQCWANQVRFHIRLQQTILIPNDLATHPCMQGQDPVQSRREILAHERLHEVDNRRATEQVRNSLRDRLGFTIGIGSLMSMVRITEDPNAFVQECSTQIRNHLDQLRDQHDIMYHRLSAEFASRLDPHDRELHELKLRLLEQARARANTH